MNDDESDLLEAPDVDNQTALRLWVKAGGRCSFPGCNDYLLRDSLTTRDIKHGHIAHIVGRRLTSPRGNDPLPLSERSKIDNLILVCQKHHSLIDDPDQVDELYKKILLDYKRRHEEHIFELTACSPDRRSKVIKLTARIGGKNVSASYSQICEALLDQDRFPRERETIEIDLTQHPKGETTATYEYGQELIRSRISPIYERGVVQGDVEHISVFAIGPMPLLVFLGTQLSDKVPTQLYQRHRDTEDWRWKKEAGRAEYSPSDNLIFEGNNPANVALILSLSGRIPLEQLYPSIDESFYVYEIALQSETPTPLFLRTIEDLEKFRMVYHSFIARVREYHSEAQKIHLFPAVPSPIAVVCGRELLHKVQPGLLVYDIDKRQGGFRPVLEVN